MKIHKNQSGFSVVEIVIIVAVVTALGFAGYSVYNRQQAPEQSATSSDVKSAPEISSTSDLDKASAALDQTDPSGSNNADAGELDSQLSAF